jgi:hypothetical protein
VDGITKHDAPPSQFVQNPYWSHYGALADYCARSSRFVTETEYSCRTALFHLVTSWWTSSINTLHRVAYYGKDEGEQRRVQHMINDYTELCKSFLFSGVDYDDLDAEVLALARVEGGVISIGRARYDTVVVPPVKNMEGYALRLLERFAAQGGKLIFCGLTPFESIEEGFDVPAAFRKLWGGLDAQGYLEKRGRHPFRTGKCKPDPRPRRPCGLGGCALAAEAAKKYSPPRTSVTVPRRPSARWSIPAAKAPRPTLCCCPARTA